MNNKYSYDNIEVFQTYGRWNADYFDGKKRFALHRASCATKKEAFEIAKEEVDFLNSKVTESRKGRSKMAEKNQDKKLLFGKKLNFDV